MLKQFRRRSLIFTLFCFTLLISASWAQDATNSIPFISSQATSINMKLGQFPSSSLFTIPPIQTPTNMLPSMEMPGQNIIDKFFQKFTQIRNKAA